jgi:Transposase IS66 family
MREYKSPPVTEELMTLQEATKKLFKAAESGDADAAERAIRPRALGRRNWTLAGSDSGGERAANDTRRSLNCGTRHIFFRIRKMIVTPPPFCRTC